MTKQKASEQEIILLSYKVIRAVGKNIKFNETIDHELSMLQLRALMLIADKENVTMSQLAKELNVKLPTATVLIDRLLVNRLVERVDDENDRRKVLITLTTKGKKDLEKSTKAKVERMTYVLNVISEQDKSNLLEILKKLYQKLEKEGK